MDLQFVLNLRDCSCQQMATPAEVLETIPEVKFAPRLLEKGAEVMPEALKPAFQKEVAAQAKEQHNICRRFVIP